MVDFYHWRPHIWIRRDGCFVDNDDLYGLCKSADPKPAVTCGCNQSQNDCDGAAYSHKHPFSTLTNFNGHTDSYDYPITNQDVYTHKYLYQNTNQDGSANPYTQTYQ